MIGFVTWPPFVGTKKGGQVTKPIILVKICYNIVSFKELQIFDEVTSWPQVYQTFWSRLPVCNVASDWPRTFLHPRCFCLAYHYFLYKQISLLFRSIYADATLKLSFEKLKPAIFF